MRGQRETRACATCGKPVTRLLSQAPSVRWYCDNRCQGKGNPSPITVAKTPNPDRGLKETRPCAVCEAPVTRYLSQVRKLQVWTCSRTCGGKVRYAHRVATGTEPVGRKKRRGEHRSCVVCGSEFYRNQSELAKSPQFCSRTCHNVAQTKEPVIKSCLRCGVVLQLKPSQSARQYCSRACQTLGRIKRPTERMHNGRPVKVDSKGYLMLWEPDHPNKIHKGWQYEHRLVMERTAGRLLTRDEHVDHINRDKQDNRPENLQILSAVEHAAKSGGEYRQDVADLRARIAAFERRYGPLEQE